MAAQVAASRAVGSQVTGMKTPPPDGGAERQSRCFIEAPVASDHFVVLRINTSETPRQRRALDR